MNESLNVSAVKKEVAPTETTATKAENKVEMSVQDLELNKQLNEADQELIDAANLAEKIAGEEGVKIKSAQPEQERSRREFTPEQSRKRAQNQREVGVRMLERRRSGLASVTQHIQIQNYLVSAFFTRFFPVIDSCLYALQSQGEYRLGHAAYTKIFNQIESRIEDFIQSTESEFSASNSLVADVKKRKDAVVPNYSSAAFDGEVQTKTPLSLKLLNAFIKLDQIIMNIEILHWNGDRMHSDVSDAVQAQKRNIAPIFTFSSRTLVQMRSRIK